MKKKAPEKNAYAPEYYITKGHTTEEAIDLANLKRRQGSILCIEHWILKGYTDADARNKIREIQIKNSKKSAHKTRGKERTQETKTKISEAIKKFNKKETFIERYGEKLGIALYEKNLEIQKLRGKKASKVRKDRGDNYRESSTRCKEYWTKRGHSDIDATNLVGKSQARCLDFFVKKYGNEDGFKRWLERNIKWQKSFITNNDMKKVNEKRRENAHVGFYTEETIRSIDHLYFYAIIMHDDDGTKFIKYGLTKHNTLNRRWKVSLGYTILFFIKMNSNDALNMERRFMSEFVRYLPSKIKTRESTLYSENIVKKCIEIVGEYNDKN